MKNKRKLVVIILNYNNGEDTIECIKSIESIMHLDSNLDISILVVDNGSSDDSVLIIKGFIHEIDAGIRLIETADNLGYAAGNNVGIKKAISLSADFIAIVNNDVIVNKYSFSPCIQALIEDYSIGIVGPVILDYGTNMIQSAGANIDYYKLKTPLLKNGQIYQPEDTISYCDYVGGACLVFRSDLINSVGYLPENYFLFWEETEWCQKIKRSGKKVGCVCNAYVHHKGSATINKVLGSGARYMERNKVVFSRRNSPNQAISILAIIRLFGNAVINGICKDRAYFKFINYYIEGVKTDISF